MIMLVTTDDAVQRAMKKTMTTMKLCKYRTDDNDGDDAYDDDDDDDYDDDLWWLQ